MKKLVIGVCLLAGGLFISTEKTEAQVRVGINVNIGDQPRWRVPGHDYVEYYYLPDIEAYYYVPRHQFIYFSNRQWVFSTSLPSRYRGYDLYSGYKVVVNRPDAYRYYEQDRVRYGRRDNDRNERYERHDNDHHDNGRHRGWDNHHHH